MFPSVLLLNCERALRARPGRAVVHSRSPKSFFLRATELQHAGRFRCGRYTMTSHDIEAARLCPLNWSTKQVESASGRSRTGSGRSGAVRRIHPSWSASMRLPVANCSRRTFTRKSHPPKPRLPFWFCPCRHFADRAPFVCRGVRRPHEPACLEVRLEKTAGHAATRRSE